MVGIPLAQPQLARCVNQIAARGGPFCGPGKRLVPVIVIVILTPSVPAQHAMDKEVNINKNANVLPKEVSKRLP
jgi:hypothetical protein